MTIVIGELATVIPESIAFSDGSLVGSRVDATSGAGGQ